jgi:hypothetical protein
MEARKTLYGDRNHVALDRSVVLGDVKYLAGDTIVTDEATAKSLVENHYGEIVSLEWTDGLKLTGQNVQFRKIL